MDDITDIREMYDASWDRENNRLNRHQLEHDVTWLYLDKYLPPSGASLLEVGSGTGKYSFELARRGYTVLAIDLAPRLVAEAKTHAIELGLDKRVEFRVGDVRTLTDVTESTFDGALVMGPLYHLVLREDRLLALQNIYKSLKYGGIIYSSWISRLGIWGQLLREKPGLIEEKGEVSSVLELGCDLDWRRSHTGVGFRGYFASVDEISPIHEEVGFQTITLAGIEPAISADDESYNCLAGDRRRLWLDFLFSLSTEPGLVASSRHLLYIGKNNKGLNGIMIHSGT